MDREEDFNGGSMKIVKMREVSRQRKW